MTGVQPAHFGIIVHVDDAVDVVGRDGLDDGVEVFEVIFWLDSEDDY